MRELNYQLKQLCRRNRDGSYRTQADRERQLTLIANQLHTLGYRKMNAQSLKPKHVEALVKHWQGEELSTGAIKNRLSVIRWWAQKVDRQNVVARSNDHYGIPERQFVSNVSKARTLTAAGSGAGARCPCPHESRTAAGLRPAARRGDQVPAALRRPRRSPRTQGELDQGRQGAGDPGAHRSAAGGARPRPTARRKRLAHPEFTQLPAAAPDLRDGTPPMRDSPGCTACAMPMHKAATRS